MTGQQIPDVNDPDVRRMVLRDHEPSERWTVAGQLIAVHCDTCLHSWPCPSIIAARQVDLEEAP